jgi:hypothetical protein
MKTTPEFNPAARQRRPDMKAATGATLGRRQPGKGKPSGFRAANARPGPDAQRNYERYLALARAEALAGDRIAAENYFQHAEHYLRSMHPDSN